MNSFENNSNAAAVKPVAWLEKHLNLSVGIYVLLSCVTFGIYSFILYFKLSRLIDELGLDIGRQPGKLRVMLWTSIGAGFGYLIIAINAVNPFIGILALACLIASFVQSVRWMFLARDIMIEYYARIHGFPLAINGFLLFFFPGICLLMAANGAERAKLLHETVR